MDLNELGKALSLAQAEMRNAEKDAANPFFKSQYTTLAAAWDACREPLTKHGLSVVQMPGTDEHGLYVTTMLLHTSGQNLSSTLRMTPKDQSPQSAGSAISYARRYALMSMVGLASADDDDDGNHASKGPAPKPAPKPVVKPEPKIEAPLESKPQFRSTPPSGEIPPDDKDRQHLAATAAGCGWSNHDVAATIQSAYKKNKLTELTRAEFNDLISHIQLNVRAK